MDECIRNLDVYSLRLPFDYIQFLDTFEDFINYYDKLSDKKDYVDIYNRYKPLATYIIRLNSKIVDGMVSFLIPNRFYEFAAIIVERKERVVSYYKRRLLSVEERDNILNMIEQDRAEIINGVIWARMCIVNTYPTFQGIKEVMNFIKEVKNNVPELNMELVYRWRNKTRLSVIYRKLTSCL